MSMDKFRQLILKDTKLLHNIHNYLLKYSCNAETQQMEKKYKTKRTKKQVHKEDQKNSAQKYRKLKTRGIREKNSTAIDSTKKQVHEEARKNSGPRRRKQKTQNIQERKNPIIDTTKEIPSEQQHSFDDVTLSADNWIKYVPEDYPKYVWCKKRSFFMFINICPYYLTYSCKKLQCDMYEYGKTVKRKFKVKTKSILI